MLQVSKRAENGFMLTRRWQPPSDKQMATEWLHWFPASKRRSGELFVWGVKVQRSSTLGEAMAPFATNKLLEAVSFLPRATGLLCSIGRVLAALESTVPYLKVVSSFAVDLPLKPNVSTWLRDF